LATEFVGDAKQYGVGHCCVCVNGLSVARGWGLALLSVSCPQYI
jgi:hypothetical protein